MRVPDDVDRPKLFELAQQNGVAFLPGVAFHYANRNKPYLRLAFGHLTEDAIQAGIPVLVGSMLTGGQSGAQREDNDVDSLHAHPPEARPDVRPRQQAAFEHAACQTAWRPAPGHPSSQNQ